jgi:hypothetical protein
MMHVTKNCSFKEKWEQERGRGASLSDVMHVTQKHQQEIGGGARKGKGSKKEERELLLQIFST